jgi:hypothetical protein
MFKLLRCDESVEGGIAACIDNENTLMRKRQTHVNELIYIFTHQKHTRANTDTRRYTHDYEPLMVALDTSVDGRAEGRVAWQSLFLCCTRVAP